MKKIIFHVAAAISFFTRIPSWKIVNIPIESYRKIICYWPLTGWITGATMAPTWMIFSLFFPPVIAVIFALLIRILLTGGLHEDGLGDFFDGFGGGRTKADILRIMKDSHLGSYALIGMIFYYLTTINILLALPYHIITLVLFIADPLAKFLSTLLMQFLPYARTEAESKSKTLYDKMSVWGILIAAVFGLSPLFLLLENGLWLSVITPLVTLFWISFYTKKKINGYTGDVCGATALLCELGFYMNVYLLLHYQTIF